MIYAGIVAGGSGTRLKSAPVPKQFLTIGEVPIIIRTVKVFCSVSEVDKIIIGIKPDWADITGELLDRYGIDRQRVLIVNGGENRNSTVLNIAAFIKEKFGITEADMILTHDAVRPFVDERIIRDNITTAMRDGLCGTYITSADTVVASQSGVYVDKTLDRRTLYQAQTPQTFPLDRLYEELSVLSAEELDNLTDTCSVFTRKGERIRMVCGSKLNFKITSKDDLTLADALAQQMQEI